MSRHEHKWVPIPGFPKFPHRLCECGAIKALEVVVGKNTISFASDIMTWSADAAPTGFGDLGMDTDTGRPQFWDGSVRNVAHTAETGISGSTATFDFTHVSGAASTGALGFTPVLALYFATLRDTGGRSHFSGGYATGTGTAARAVTHGNSLSSDYNSYDVDAIAGYQAGTSSTSYDSDLDVTAFSSSNITLTWSLGSLPVSFHGGRLIVFG